MFHAVSLLLCCLERPPPFLTYGTFATANLGQRPPSLRYYLDTVFLLSTFLQSNYYGMYKSVEHSNICIQFPNQSETQVPLCLRIFINCFHVLKIHAIIFVYLNYNDRHVKIHTGHISILVLGGHFLSTMLEIVVGKRLGLHELSLKCKKVEIKK